MYNYYLLVFLTNNMERKFTKMNDICCYVNDFKDLCFDYYYNVKTFDKLNTIKKLHNKILKSLFFFKYNSSTYNDDEFIIKMIYLLMSFTIYIRDKYYGMGSYELFQLQVHNYIIYMNKGLIHEKNIYILLLNVVKRQNKEENIGCWKDLKCLANYLSHNSISHNNTAMEMIYDIYSKQIIKDLIVCDTITDENQTISWCGKWIPREKSAYGWMVPYIMKHLFKLDYQCSPKVYYFYLKKYRKIVSKLNIGLVK